MPWHVEHPCGGCPKSKPWGVVKDADGEVEGCHPTKAKADAQLAALYAAEPSARARLVVQVSAEDLEPYGWICEACGRALAVGEFVIGEDAGGVGSAWRCLACVGARRVPAGGRSIHDSRLLRLSSGRNAIIFHPPQPSPLL